MPDTVEELQQLVVNLQGKLLMKVNDVERLDMMTEDSQLQRRRIVRLAADIQIQARTIKDCGKQTVPIVATSAQAAQCVATIVEKADYIDAIITAEIGDDIDP